MAKKKKIKTPIKKAENYCILCGRSEKLAGFMLEGEDGIHICADCIKYANELIDEYYINEKKDQLINELGNCPKPIEIKKYLDEYVIGQDEAKETLAVAVYNHYKRLKYAGTLKDTDNELIKSNVILAGNSGCGKSYLCQKIAEYLGIPVVIVDSTTFTEAGYVGEDVESILSRLYQASGYDVKKTEWGIVVLDELDKLSRKSANPSITRDVNGEGVQQSILKLLEGSIVNVPPHGGRKHPDQPMIQIDTKNILFIGLGAFEGIERNIGKRLNTRAVGFKTTDNESGSFKLDRNNLLQYASHQDLRDYGMIPELLGRMPVLTTLDSLDKEALQKILIEPKNAIIKQYIRMFKIDNIKLSFESSVYEYIAEKAIELKLGARGLRTIVETILKKTMFELPSTNKKSFRVTLSYAKQQFEKSKFMKAQKALLAKTA